MVLRCHFTEGILDNHRRVRTHAQLQEHDPRSFVPPQEILVAPRRLIPALVLHEGIIYAQVHGQGTAAARTARNQFGGDLHIPLLRSHAAHRLLIVEGFLAAGLGALPETIVSLGVEQMLFIKARQLELMVHIGGHNKVIFTLHQLQKRIIDRLGRFFIAVHQDMAAPPGPELLQRGERVKPAGVHVPDAVLLREVSKVLFKAFPGIGQARRGGQSGSRADHHGVRFVKRPLQPPRLLRAGFGRFARPYL